MSLFETKQIATHGYILFTAPYVHYASGEAKIHIHEIMQNNFLFDTALHTHTYKDPNGLRDVSHDVPIVLDAIGRH